MAEGGVVPYEHSGPSGFVRVGPGWQRFGGGSVRVGGRPAVPMRPRAALSRPQRGASGDVPPGYYNPERDWAVQTGQRKLGQGEEEASTTRLRSEDDYQRALGQIQEREGFRRTDAAKALAAVKRSFGALGTRQEEQANKAGVLQGGALIQSAAKRAVNQGRTEGEQGEALQRALAGDHQHREQLALEHGPPVAGASWEQLAGGGAGRELVDLAKHILNARVEQTELGKQETEGKSAEAAQLGYEPIAPRAKAAVHRATRTRARGRRR